MSVCAILYGADDWNSIRLFAEHKEDRLRKHLTLPGGIPVTFTFNRIFASFDPEKFRVIFIQWMRDVLSGLEGRIWFSTLLLSIGTESFS